MLNWYEKPLSIKPQAGLPERIAAFIEKADTPKPTNAKELLLTLLQTAETDISKEFHQSVIEDLKQSLRAQQELADGYYKDFLKLKEETEGLREENERLLAETKRLQAENEELSKEETITGKWFDGLRLLAPELIREEDKTFEDSIGRMLFVIKNGNEEVNQANAKIETLETELEAAKNRKIALKDNQAIVDFTPEQQDNIKLLRKMLAKSGTSLKTQDASEVIHLSIENNIAHTKEMVAMCRDFAPLLEIL